MEERCSWLTESHYCRRLHRRESASQFNLNTTQYFKITIICCYLDHSVISVARVRDSVMVYVVLGSLFLNESPINSLHSIGVTILLLLVPHTVLG